MVLKKCCKMTSDAGSPLGSARSANPVCCMFCWTICRWTVPGSKPFGRWEGRASLPLNYWGKCCPVEFNSHKIFDRTKNLAGGGGGGGCCPRFWNQAAALGNGAVHGAEPHTHHSTRRNGWFRRLCAVHSPEAQSCERGAGTFAACAVRGADSWRQELPLSSTACSDFGVDFIQYNREA